MWSFFLKAQILWVSFKRSIYKKYSSFVCFVLFTNMLKWSIESTHLFSLRRRFFARSTRIAFKFVIRGFVPHMILHNAKMQILNVNRLTLTAFGFKVNVLIIALLYESFARTYVCIEVGRYYGIPLKNMKNFLWSIVVVGKIVSLYRFHNKSEYIQFFKIVKNQIFLKNKFSFGTFFL